MTYYDRSDDTTGGPEGAESVSAMRERGFEPRCPVGRWILSQEDSPTAPAAPGVPLHAPAAARRNMQEKYDLCDDTAYPKSYPALSWRLAVLVAR
jgi:hypothetical protein